jgi:hypothetical protein
MMIAIFDEQGRINESYSKGKIVNRGVKMYQIARQKCTS